MNFYSWETVFECWRFLGFSIFVIGIPIIIVVSISALIIFFTQEKS